MIRVDRADLYRSLGCKYEDQTVVTFLPRMVYVVFGVVVG